MQSFYNVISRVMYEYSYLVLGHCFKIFQTELITETVVHQFGFQTLPTVSNIQSFSVSR